MKGYKKASSYASKLMIIALVMTACVALLSAPAFSQSAAGETKANYQTGKVGVGYQGMFLNGILNGISVRGWMPNNFGLEGNFFYGSIDAEVTGPGFSNTDADADVMLFELKPMYAFIVKPNSRFYAGVKMGYGKVSAELGNALDYDSDIWTLGALVGSEFSFPYMPEVSFNFDVGYNYSNFDGDESVNNADVDVDLDGIFVTLGIKYYF